MKKTEIWVLLFAINLPLYAQIPENVFVYVAPVTGEGIEQNDGVFIEKLLEEEVKLRDYVAVSSSQAADFLLIGTIVPYYGDFAAGMEGWEPGSLGNAAREGEGGIASGWEADSGWESQAFEPSGTEAPLLYLFHVQLQDAQSNIILVEQDLIYGSMDDFILVFPIVMNNIFSQPLLKFSDPDDSWRNKWLYVKASAIWTPRVYLGLEPSTYYNNFGGGLGAELHFLNFMSAEMNIEIAPDWIRYDRKLDDRYLDLVMEIPLLIKFVFKPSWYFMLEPYAGVQFNISLFRNTVPPLFSWLIGMQYGVKVGKGVIFVEPRFAMDIGRSGLNVPRAGLATNAYRRLIIYLGIGYKFGFFSRVK